MTQMFQSEETLEAFYRATYPSTLVEVISEPGSGVSLVSAQQDAGDYSDIPLSDLVITRVVTPPGHATLDVGAGQFTATVRRNELIVVPPNVATTILLDSPHEIEAVAIPHGLFRNLSPDPDACPDGFFGKLHTSTVTCPRLTALCGSISHELRLGNPRGTLFVEQLVADVSVVLHQKSTGLSLIPVGSLAPWQTARVMDYLESHLTEPVSLQTLADLLQMSVFHFARSFKVATGVAPHQFHHRLRMERARFLLAKSDRSMTDIGLSLGYDSSQSFARMFRAMHRMTPSEFRKRS